MGTMMRVDATPAKGYMDRITQGTRRATDRALRDMARDAALLARAHAPHNMDRKGIKWDVSRLGPIIRADGPTAAYDGGELKRTFSHPVFPQAGSDRTTWNWAEQHTLPFIEIAAREVTEDADLVMSVELQKLFDAEE
jgi:hypothetical protein